MFFSNEKLLKEEIEHLKKENEKLKLQLKNDDLLIDEINIVLKQFEKGLYDMSVKGSSQNEKLNQIKMNLNKALKTNAEFSNEAIEILIEYGNAKYDFPIETENLSGKMGSIILGIRSLGSGISEILALLDVTDELNKQLINLSQTATSLSNSSNEQAASLEETAAALEEVTSTIVNNTENTIKMSNLSKEVESSASRGNELAITTSESMESINKEVETINEAITVIDQIAFQTNILSLNAAVEAATAGEAGKGFAVVAGEVRNLANRSAEAAKGIKEIVSSATSKAIEGKNIANNMIDGYKVLNENIKATSGLIFDVSNASKEQQQAIEQINDAVAQLDQATQKNAASATSISDQCIEIQKMTETLSEVAKYTSYEQKAQEQVCDIPLMFELNKLKLDHINFKDSNFKKLNENSSFKVVTDHECNLGKWIDEQERLEKNFTKTNNWKKLKAVHHQVHNGVQNIVDNTASKNYEKVLNDTLQIDQAISDVFWSIQNVKKENCN